MPKINLTQVAPFAGAWIEIKKFNQEIIYDNVAPFAGAWIEISIFAFATFKTLVAPFAGAWIEIISEHVINCQQ